MKFDLNTNTHFVSIPLRSPIMKDFPINQQFLQQKYDVLKQFKEKAYFEKSVQLKVTPCISIMNLVSKYTDSESHVNETSMQMLAANDMVLMLCSLHNYTLQVEDTMIPSGEAENATTESSTAGQQIIFRSKTDYVCFIVQGQTHTVAVLLETKVDYNLNAIAKSKMFVGF